MPKETESVFATLDADKAVRDFADLICGDEIAKADVLYAAERAKGFEWSGGRLFVKMPGGERVAATDPRAVEHFKNKYPFLMPTPKATEQEFNGATVTIDPATIEAALSGSVTAKGKIAVAFGADHRDSPTSRAAAAKAELFLTAEAAKKYGTGTDDTDAVVHGRPAVSTNPFYRLRRPDGTIDKSIEAQIGKMISAIGHHKATDIARAAKSPAAPLGLSLTGLPLKA